MAHDSFGSATDTYRFGSTDSGASSSANGNGHRSHRDAGARNGSSRLRSLSNGSEATLDPSAPEDDVMDPLVLVTEREGLDPLASRLLGLKMWLHDDLDTLERAIDGMSVAEPDLAQKAASHLLSVPGKRIRPLCVILSARLGDREMDWIVRDLAVSCELVHAATLLHDDVLDMGDERRGEPTSRLIYGNSASILGGDYLLVDALRRVNRTEYPSLLTELLHVIDRMVHAEALQLERRGRFDPRPEIYMEVIEGKTAALFKWGLQAGSTVAGLEPEQIAALGRIGEHFGTAFQLTDDVLDLAGDPAETGKSAFADLKEGKLTWPLIIGAAEDKSLYAQLEAASKDPIAFTENGTAARIVERLRELGAIDRTRDKAAHHAAQALREMEAFPRSRARTAMEAIIESVVARTA